MTQEINEQSEEHTLKTKNKKHIISIILLIVVNIAMFTFTPLDSRTIYERFMVALPGFVISLPTIGFVLGLGASLIPYKKLSYSKKYLHSSLLVIKVANILTFAMMVVALGLLFLNS